MYSFTNVFYNYRALEVLTLGIKFFTKSHPPIFTYIDNPKHELVILELEKDFYIPKYNFSELNIFTYGGILCILHFLCKAYMKINDNLRKKAESQEKMFLRRTVIAQPCIEDVVRFEDTEDTSNKKMHSYLPIILAQADMDAVHDPIGAMHKFASTCFNLFDMPWFLKINFQTVQLTLEMLTHFVALELSSDLTCSNMTQQMKEYMKREIGTEMQFFNDFVKRSTQERLETTKIPLSSPRERMKLERLAKHMITVLSNDEELHDEFFWVLNHLVQDSCQTEDDN